MLTDKLGIRKSTRHNLFSRSTLPLGDHIERTGCQSTIAMKLLEPNTDGASMVFEP